RAWPRPARWPGAAGGTGRPPPRSRARVPPGSGAARRAARGRRWPRSGRRGRPPGGAGGLRTRGAPRPTRGRTAGRRRSGGERGGGEVERIGEVFQHLGQAEGRAIQPHLGRRAVVAEEQQVEPAGGELQGGSHAAVAGEGEHLGPVAADGGERGGDPEGPEPP